MSGLLSASVLFALCAPPTAGSDASAPEVDDEGTQASSPATEPAPMEETKESNGGSPSAGEGEPSSPDPEGKPTGAVDPAAAEPASDSVELDPVELDPAPGDDDMAAMIEVPPGDDEASATSKDAPAPEGPTQAPDPMQDRRRARGLTDYGAGGIALFLQGGALLGAGIPLMLRDDTLSKGNNAKLVSTKDLGLGLTIAGGVSAAAGLGMFIADRVLVGRRMRRYSVGGGATAEGGAVTLSGRF